ncbi:hypothetical protein NE865_07846 [Phthorimaea operculella]|nr:hypothetical protein NE865_07846 [Phthorimaea operculella]
MKLSLVFELLLIFVLLAFAASKSVGKNKQKAIQNRNDGGAISVTVLPLVEEKQDDSSISTINKYCKCSEEFCNCCRDFAVPYINLDGPGCASLMYLNGDKMSVSLSFGRKVITNKTIASRKPSPVCMPLPGGVSKFCGRVYNIARTGEEFRACLGLELQSKKTVEAAVRVSCFKFGPKGVRDLDAINDVEGADYTGFSLLGEDLLGDLFDTTSASTAALTFAANPSTAAGAPSFADNPSTAAGAPSFAANPSTAAGSTTTERFLLLSTANDDTYQPVVIVTQRPSSTLSYTTQKASTNFEDPGLEMSLAQLTGQLAAMPASPIIPEDSKDTGMMTSRPDLVSYQRIETITPKGITVSFAPVSEENFREDMVQIVHSLDSNSEEQTSDKVLSAEETRSNKYVVPVPVHYEGLSLPKRERQFRLEDLDVLDLSEIGETVGDQLGLFGRKKRQNKVQTNDNKKPESESEDEEDDDDDDDSSDFDVLGLEQIGETVGEQIGLFGRGKRQKKDKESNDSNKKDEDDDDDLGLDAIGEALILDRSGKNAGLLRKDRRRQNKMMRGDWAQSHV